MTEKDLLVKESAMIFCGLFSFTKTEFDHGFNNSRYVEYDQLPDNNNTFSYFRTLYYPNFCNSIISKKVHSNFTVSDIPFRHHLVKEIDQFKKMVLITEKDSSIKFSITKAELFLFNENTSFNKNQLLGIYSFSVQIDEPEVSLNTISSFISAIRVLSSKNKISINNNQYTTLEFIEKFIVCKSISDSFITSIMGNKLKTYSVTSLKTNQQDYKSLLFDLATACPIRMNNESSLYSPSEEYYDSIFEKNLVSVFNNWHALALFDSFTVLGSEMDNINLAWVDTYFFIYIQCLRIKFYMFRINAEFTNITSLNKHSEEMRNSFIEYINKNNYSIISYNFLPNVLHQKISQSLDIPNEVTDLEQKISNINLLFREGMEKRLNKILFLVALLSLSTGILDTTTLIIKLSSSNEVTFYPLWGGILSFSIISLIFIYFLISTRRIRKR